MSRNDQRDEDDRRGAAEQDQDAYPGTDTSRGNQGRDEPVPASHHEERDQEAVVRNEEHAAGDLGTRPSGRGAGE